MVLNNIGARGASEKVQIAQAEAPEFQDVRWWRMPNMRKLYWHCTVLLIASATTGYDGQMLNASQLMNDWQSFFGHPQSAKLGLMNNAFNIGSIVSFFIVPYMADWFGRKVPIATGCLIMIAGGFVGAFSQNWAQYLAGRLILGFGNSLAQMSSPILLTEICHPQHRARLTAVYNCLWNLGSLFVAWIAWATINIPNSWSWRSITLMQIIPSVFQITFIYWVPESPRWLIFKGKNEKALQMLSYYHAEGNMDDVTVQFEYKEIRDTIQIEKEVLQESSYMDFLRTRGNRWRLAILISLGIISQYSGNALFSNYINLIYEGAGIKSQSQKIALNGGSTILSLIVSVTAAQFVDRFGRRPLFLVATAGMVVTFICWTITSAVYEDSNSTNSGAGYAQIPFVWLFGVFYSFAWSGLLVAYSLEILPFKLRAKGLMIMNITVQAVLAVGNQTNPIAWKNLPKHWNFTLFYTLWICVEFIFVYFVYVETKGPTLEEVARIFDGDEAVAHVDITQVEKEFRTNSMDQHEQIEHHGAKM